MEKTKEIIEDAIIDDSFYDVIMFNDDVTPFEYVIAVLIKIFSYDFEKALKTTMYINDHGQAVVATFSMQEAYEKVEEVEAMNAEYGFLLQTNVEKN